MFTKCLYTAIVICAAVASGLRGETTPGRPNIVIIMADDMGFSDLGCYGSEIATPNIDRLAAGGLRFTQFYNTARCCPTRASLLTGLYPHQAGVGHMVGKGPAPAYQGYLNDRCVTVAEVLKQGGYHTLMAGKWHVGEDRPHWPCDRGFDEYFGLISGASSYFSIDPGRKFARGNEPIDPVKDRFYMTDAFTDEAIGFLDKYGRQPQPFFLYLAYTSPHWPLHAWPEDIAKYRGKYRIGWDALRQQRHNRMIEMGIVDPRWPLSPRDPEAPAWTDAVDKDDLDLRMAVYAAQIDRMDQNIGRVLNKISGIGAEQNTLIFFLADNGACAEKVDRGRKGAAADSKDSYFSYGLPWANASNTPFRLYKHWVHEGGISTPLIAYWPAVIDKRGAITREVGHLVDLMATCLDAAGVKYPATYRDKPITPLEGKSLVPIFRTGTRLGHEALFWEHEGNRAVREGKWKLVSRHPGKWELYDLEADRTELNNLADKYPDRVKSMADKYKAWADRCGVLPWDQVTGSKKPETK
ncbi:MAG: arylsulfatase [Phycisphaerae bacterium]